jgi:hypothetical protein
MSWRGSQAVQRFWRSEWSLSVLLALLVFDGFFLGPIMQSQEDRD